ncbi:energy-coupling factor transporter transmembrane component T family protein [Treponema putidum]|uniref:energy-coupling factor transporter transmembrane component T family protein n=1 Tax=Treponema putidum TaxID=221027 RepID=UPI003D8A917A
MKNVSKDFPAPVKLWALLCVIVSSFFIADYRINGILSLIGLLYLAVQCKWRLLISFGLFYALLLLLLIGIRRYGIRTIIIPEFYIFLCWSLLPVMLTGWDVITTPPGELAAFLSRIGMPVSVILGLLVIFRFIPVMKAEVKKLRLSMKTKGLLEPIRILTHPLETGEYVLIPLLLRCIQIADQLAVSAIVRGIQCPVKRSSYYEKKMRAFDYIAVIVWSTTTAAVIMVRSLA